jgi:hypothetical protein
MEIARYWRSNGQRYRLAGAACPHCGQLSFPPRPDCPVCSAQPMQILGGGLSVWPAAIGSADLPVSLSYHFAERLTG